MSVDVAARGCAHGCALACLARVPAALCSEME
jgi:hypothetical protein